MNLDYLDGIYILQGTRKEIDSRKMMLDHGFDLSLPRSDNQNVTLFTKEPYAAVTFIASGTNRAQHELSNIQRQIETSRALDGRNIACPVIEKLAGYQKASVAYALERRNTLIADEPGTGKTAEAICFCNEIKAKKILVICPAAIRRQWEEAIPRWTLMQWPYLIYSINTISKGINTHANWIITSYDLARKESIGAQIAKMHFDVGIFDEVHYLKTPDSARTRAIFGGGEDRKFDPLAFSCERLLALSGTPIPNRPREAYTLARGMCFDAIDWLSYDRFTERFNPSRRGERVNVETGAISYYNDERTGRHAELQNRLRANFMTRHLKREVLTQLKLPSYDIVRAEETGPVRAALAAEKMLDINPDSFNGNSSLFGGAIASVRRQMGEALAPQVVIYSDLLLTGGIDKLVIFAWHKSVLDILEKGLHKWGVVRVDGNTTGTARHGAILAFQQKSSVHVIIGNLLSLGTGTDGLQNVSSNVVIAEPSWVPGENVQAIDRLDRMGQKRTVMADIFVAPRSFSEYILESALRKGQVLHKSLDLIGG